MYEAFLVTLRETAELMLITWGLCGYLQRASRPDLVPKVYLGLLWGILGGAAAVVVSAEAVSIDPRWDPALTVVAALGVLIVATGMTASVARIRTRIRMLFDSRLQGPKAPAFVAVLSGVFALRESLEVVLFLRAVESIGDAAHVALGAALGFLAAGLCVVAWRNIKSQLALRVLFRLSALLLAYLSVRLLVWGGTRFLTAHAAVEGSPELAETAQLFASGGPWHGWLCAALMVAPLWHLASSWWQEASSSSKSV